MNFKMHVDYAVKKLASVGGDCDVHYHSGCGVLPPKKLIDEIVLDMGQVTTLDGIQGKMTAALITVHSQWARWGLNTFDPTASLVAGLLITTPTKEPGLPRMPYPTFFIRVPRGFLPFWVANQDEPEWIEGIMVSRLKVANSDPPSETIEIHLIGPGQGENGIKERTLMTSVYEKGFTSPADHVDIDEQLWNAPVIPLSEPIGDPEDHVAVTNKDGITKRLAFRLFANLCSWLESIGGLNGRRPSNSPKSKKNEDGWDHLEDRTRIAQWIVGQEVKLSPELIASAKQHVLGLGAGKKGWHLQTMHTVRGHIRHQACGPRHSERKVIWIEPFTKGPANGDVIAHVYKAQEKAK